MRRARHSPERAARKLGASLERLGYTDRGLAAAPDDYAAVIAPRSNPQLSRTGPLVTLVKLFLVGAPDSAREADEALRALGAPAARGLVEAEGDEARGRVRLVPYQHLILACDPPTARNRADFVDGVTRPAHVLDLLTPRRPVARALDVGTGCGIQALLAARHARRVVGGRRQPAGAPAHRVQRTPERRSARGGPPGKLFGPVRDERFDLIVANPPYVISPESAFTFRDSGEPGDRLCRRLVQEAPRHLSEGGYAVLLVNWIHGAQEPWWAPLRPWVAGRGFDAWLLRLESMEPVAYAVAWNAPLALRNRGQYAAAIDRWVAYYRQLRIEAIGMGAIILRRRRRDATGSGQTMCRAK